MNAIWIDLPADEMNVAAGFRLALDLPLSGAVLRIAAADSYRLWIDGRLAAHGPARTAHGHARVDELSLSTPPPESPGRVREGGRARARPSRSPSDLAMTSLAPGRAALRRGRNSGPAGHCTLIFVEVHSANVPAFDAIRQSPFFAAEVVATDGRVLAEASDFEAWRDGTLVQRVRRYSFQRGFVESRRMAADPSAFFGGGEAPEGWRRAVAKPVPLPKLLPRGVPYPALAFHDVGAPVSRFSVMPDFTAVPPPRREVSLVGIDGFMGFRPEEWEDDSALDAARLVGAADIAAAESQAAPNDVAPEVLGDAANPSTASADAGGHSGGGRSGGGRSLSGHTYDFGRTLTGFFSLRVDATAPSGATILLVYDETAAPEGSRFPVNPLRGSWTRVLKWRLAPGRYDLLSFQPVSARVAAVAILDGEAEIERLGIVDYENPDASRVSLPATGDADLDAIVAAARATFAQNAVDLLTDCPSRERAAYPCDNFFAARAEALFTGRSVIERATHENYALSPQSPYLPNGMIPMCYPSDHIDGLFIPTFAMWWILALAEYRKRTEDEALIALARPKLEGLLAWFSRYIAKDGLLEDLPGWVFVEWSACNDKDRVCGTNFPSNFVYASMLEAAAGLLGRPELAAQGAAVRDKAAALAWNGEWFEDNAVRDAEGVLRRLGHVSETGQYYAFWFGAASPETHASLWNRLCAEFGPSRDIAKTYPDIPASNAIIGAYLRLELLLRFGHARQCLDECKELFLPMARKTGTLWENLSPNSSLNHGFAASAAWLIYKAHGVVLSF